MVRYLLACALLLAGCEHMGKNDSFSHMGGGGGGGGGYSGASSHSTPSLTSAPSGHSHSSSSGSSTSGDGLDGVVETVVEAAAATLAEGADPGTTTEAPAATSPRPPGDLCLDCPDPGNCGSCPAVPVN
jgi:hypothetical protein